MGWTREGRAPRFLGQDVHRGPLPSHQGLPRPGHVSVYPSPHENSRVSTKWAAALGILHVFNEESVLVEALLGLPVPWNPYFLGGREKLGAGIF